tara:strand:+ start:1527 stop:2858 length:1332 start_codon:yes stop_codon:yes gene_type:complete
MKKNKITIIGGGPAGLACAYYAKNKGIEFIVYEASNSFGGNCQTIKFNDFYFDTGAHRLHDKDSDTTKIFKNLLKERLRKIHVPSQIYRDGKFIDFPLSPYGLFNFLGPINFIKESLAIIFNSFKSKNKIKNFEDFAINKFGKKIAHLFLLEYSNKLWGLHTSNLSTVISGNRLKGLSIYTLILETIFGKKRKTKHLDGSFYYPDNGIGVLFDELIYHCGVSNFNSKSKVTRINHSDNRINSIVINNQDNYNINHLVSSMPLGIFIESMSPPPPNEILSISKSIKFRNVILVCFFLDKKKINNNGSMYFPDKKYLFTRIYEPKNRSIYMSPNNKTSLIVEIPCFKNDDIWVLDKNDLIKKIKEDLINLKFFNKDHIIDSSIYKISNAYPILELNFEKKIKKIFDYLSRFKNLDVTGRNGLFAYTHIHDHMKNGREIIDYYFKK